jgi:imidazolonepropionase-like amidohydrolase
MEPLACRRLAPALVFACVLVAQEAAAAPSNGAHAIVNARIVPAPGQLIERGNIVIRDGVVTAVGANAAVPADARRWNGDSLTVYAGMIESYYDAPERGRPARPGGGGFPPATAPTEPEVGAAHPLLGVTPERRVVERLAGVADSLASLRRAGFAVAHLVPASGIVRGQSAIASLAAVGKNDAVLRTDVAQIMSLETQPGGYPGSLMGAVAVVRQAFMDARWYDDVWSRYKKAPSGKPKPMTSVSWAALKPAVDGTQPVFIETHGMLEVLRAAAVAREAKVTPRIIGSGDEYKRVKDIVALNVPLIVPVNYPDAPEFETSDDALEVGLTDLRYWNDAPGNAAALAKAGARFALTAFKLKDPTSFRGAVTKAIERGLDPNVALAAVTTVPAEILGLSDRLGTIAVGKAATFTITRGALFDSTSKVVEIWVDGVRQPVTAPDEVASPKGNWDLAWGNERARILVQTTPDTSIKLVRSSGDTIVANGPRVDRERVQFTARFEQGLGEFDLMARDERLIGTVNRQPGPVVGVRAPEGSGRGKESAAETSKVKAAPVVTLAGVMGDIEPWRAVAPVQPAAVLVRNATIWTAGAQGTIENADLLVRGGKIVSVGKGLKAPSGATVVDGTGKHVMPGILDCHSHSAILDQVNECTNIVTAEVRVADVVNSESIQIYNQLAGGTTIMHLLHGSCNSIGGQCAVIKNRWGEAPDRLLMAAPPTIKFALGENPKRASVAGGPRRYPDTRGGVEESIRDAFTRARDYGLAMDEWKKGRAPAPPRRDLQLDAVLEILNGQRLIHAHSYRQDEILALLRLCEEFDVQLQTLQHILEGYKVADEIASHGASASAFSDWWAYKMEVIDAIPHNGYLMWDRGVNVSYNSDSNDLARRLNTEAAKAVKYGGVPPEEAIKFVTLNPAKQLEIDDRVGSLEAGKDADFSIWSGTPLSPYSLCEQTWIEGRKYFDRAADLAGRAALAKERDALIAKARAASKPKGAGARIAQRFGYLEDNSHGESFCEGEDGR